MNCPSSDTLIQAYVDGELEGADRQEIEIHMLECAACGAHARLLGRFKAAVRGHLPPPAVPPAFKARLQAALAQAEPGDNRAGWTWWPRLVPAFAAAAALVVIVMGARHGGMPAVIQQALRAHSTELPMDVIASDCARIANWFRGKVDFNVQPPPIDRAAADSGRPAATCAGGRLMNIRDRFGAYIVYRVADGHRISLLVFDGDEEEIRVPQARHLGGRIVYMQASRGASTAAFRERDGLNYVVASDLDEDTLSRVMEAAFRPRH